MIKIIIFFNIAFMPYFFVPIAHAASEVLAQDMLTDSSNDNENSDAVSKWGQAGEKMKRPEVTRAEPLAPISDESFTHNIAAATTSVSRAPAGVPDVNPKTRVRMANEKKTFQEVAVIASDLGFFPSTLFVTQGMPVRLYVTGASLKSQCFMFEPFGIRRQIQNQKIEEITFTPDQSGKFAFTCPMTGAKGAVVVKELAPTTDPSTDDRTPASDDAGN